MTVIPNFSPAVDLFVEALMPDQSVNAFIIGVSEIGGPDVLFETNAFVINESLIGGTDTLGESGSSGLIWNRINCTISKADITIGGEVQSNLYFQPAPASMSLTIQSWDLDPNNNLAFRAGTGIRIKIDSSAQKTLFSGYIDQISVTYRSDGPNLIQITAFDAFKRYVNTRIAELDTTTGFPGYVTPNEQLQVIAEALGTNLNSSLSQTTAGKLPSVIEDDVITSKYIYDAIRVGLGLFWVDQRTGQFVSIPRPSQNNPPQGTPVIGNNHGEDYHLCMSDIAASNDANRVINNLKVALESNPATYTIRQNIDAIQLYGETAQDIQLNTTDLTELNRWADAAFSTYPTRLISSVQTPAIDRDGSLTEAAFFDPGQLIGVKYSTSDININDYYTVTRVSHSIDVDNWFTTLELWKEL